MATRKLHTIEKRMIPSSDRDIRILIMRPTKNARPRESTPGILWLHGGGHLHGMHPKILLPHARLLVEKYGAVVVAPEYRTAFEKPFPADLEDCYAALLFLKVHADELGINDAQIMVGGESAGGGLTVATCLLARDIGEVNIAFQMPLYPMLDDLAAQYPSVQLKSVQIDHAAYTNASGATTNTATYTVQLNVILCDKESVVS